MRLSNLLKGSLVGLTTAAFIVGCGGGGENNDQGVTFTLLGFFPGDVMATTGAAQLPRGLTGLVVPISTVVNETDIDASGPTAGSEFAGSTSTGGFVRAAVGLQNNLPGQFVRAERIFLSYDVQGANQNPPDTSVPLGVVIGPSAVTATAGTGGLTTGAGTSANGDVFNGSDTSLPPNFRTLGNRQFAAFPVIPSEIRAWISLNRTQLPEPPFTMGVTTVVQGVTSAGNVVQTNHATLFVSIVPETPVVPPDGTSDTAGAVTAGSTNTSSDSSSAFAETDGTTSDATSTDTSSDTSL